MVSLKTWDSGQKSLKSFEDFFQIAVRDCLPYSSMVLMAILMKKLLMLIQLWTSLVWKQSLEDLILVSQVVSEKNNSLNERLVMKMS